MQDHLDSSIKAVFLYFVLGIAIITGLFEYSLGKETSVTDKNLTEIVCIIDRSGSMEDIKNDAIGGFNAFLEGQKEQPGSATLTYCQFDQEYEIVHDGKPIQDVPPLTDKSYVPRGSTALLDAIGRTIITVGARLSTTPEDKRPGKVIVVILTDGLENSSREFTGPQIKKMVEEQTNKYQWQFVYLAANQDAFMVGEALGIQPSARAAFVASAEGTSRAFGTISSSVTSYRKSGSIGHLNQQ